MANPYRFNQDIKVDPPDSAKFSLNNPKISGVNSGEMKDIKGIDFYNDPKYSRCGVKFGL
jgi:hypothetical protein